MASDACVAITAGGKAGQSRARNFEQSKDRSFFLAPGVFDSLASQEMRTIWAGAKGAEALGLDMYKNEYR